MKPTDNKTKRLDIRLSESDFKLFKICAYTVGQNPSALVRMFVDSTINALKVKVKQGEINLEDYESLLDDKL